MSHLKNLPRVSRLNSFHIMKTFAIIIIILDFLIYEKQTFRNIQIFNFLTCRKKLIVDYLQDTDFTATWERPLWTR